MKATPVEQFDTIPPCICRICARRKTRAKTLKEISSESRLSYRKTNWIARQATWAGIRLEDAQKFALACGVDLLRPRLKLFYLRRAWSGTLSTLARGLSLEYVSRQIRIREQFEEGSIRSTGNHNGTGSTRGKKNQGKPRESASKGK